MTLAASTIAQACSGVPSGATNRLVLLRHAEADFHGRFCGHSNPSLTMRGRTRLLAIIQGLSLASISPTAIWSSDLRRATETAEPVAKHFGLNYSTSPGLREMNFGSWEGLSWSEVESRYPEDSRAWMVKFPHHRPPGGESFLELQARVIDELQSLADQAEPVCTLVVTHAGFIRTAVAWVLGMSDECISRIALNHCAISILENVRNHWSLSAMNLDFSRFGRMNTGDGDCP